MGHQGNAFALLSEDGPEDEGSWEQVQAKKKKPGKPAQPAAKPSVPISYQKATPQKTQSVKAPTGPVSSAGSSSSSYRTVESSNPPTAVSGSHDSNGRPVDDTYYRAFQKCFYNDRTKEAVLRFHKTDIVRVKSTGEVILNTGGYSTLTTFLSMKEALSMINIQLKSHGQVHEGNWYALDGSTSHAYEDNVVIPAKTSSDRNRASVLVQSMQAMTGKPQEAPGSVSKAVATRPPVKPTAPPNGISNPAVRPVAQAAQPAGLSFAQRLQTKPRSQQQQPPEEVQVGAKPSNLTAEHFEQLLSVADDVDDESCCVICMLNPRDTVLIPCGHCVMCEKCTESVMTSSVCPMCRQAIDDKITMGA